VAINIVQTRQLTDGAALEHAAPVSTATSVLLADFELDVSDSQSASSDLLSESSDVPEPYYWKDSTEPSCWETFPLSRQSPEEIEEYKQVCAAAYQRALGFRPMMPSSSIHHPESEDSSSVEDPIAFYSLPESMLNDADDVNLQASWRRYSARCRRTMNFLRVMFYSVRSSQVVTSR
jgi:hypothetical protein